MDEHAAPSESNRAKRRKYRDTYEDEKRKRLGSLAEAWAKFGGILDVLIVPSNVDMESSVEQSTNWPMPWNNYMRTTAGKFY